MEKGEVEVTVTGEGFLNLPTLACRFGLSYNTKPAQFVSSQHILCLTPAESEPGLVNVEITHNGVDYTAQGLTYTFLPMASLSRVVPEAGLIDGGMAVEIQGSGFSELGGAEAHISCRWEMPGLNQREILITRASVISESSLSCTTPPAAKAGSAHVSVFADKVNIADVDDLTLGFGYELPATSVALVPSHGQPSGGTKIRVFGEGFIDSSDLACRFHSMPIGGGGGREDSDGVTTIAGVIEVPAAFLTAEEVQCSAPALTTMYFTQEKNTTQVGHALVEVSNHGWSSEAFDPNKGLSFWYRPQPKVSVVIFRRCSHNSSSSVHGSRCTRQCVSAFRIRNIVFPQSSAAHGLQPFLIFEYTDTVSNLLNVPPVSRDRNASTHCTISYCTIATQVTALSARGCTFCCLGLWNFPQTFT